MVVTPSVGELLRSWRQRRRMTQLDLADQAGIAVKLLCQIETGRTAGTRDMVVRLAERLGVPLRDRNAILTAAGYGPLFPDRPFDDPALRALREGVMTILTTQEPAPSMAVDRHWTLIAANDAFYRLVAGVDPLLLRPPVNVLRLWLHPVGLAPRIANLREWREHMVHRLRRRIESTGDPDLSDLMEEIQDYPLPRGAQMPQTARAGEQAVLPFRLVTIDGTMSFCSAITTFDTALDVRMSELAVETLLPLDQETATILRQMAETSVRPKAELITTPFHSAVAD